MKTSEVHKMSNEELAAEETRLRRRLFDLRAQAVTDKLENPRLFIAHRKDIARILTEKKLRVSTSSKGKA
jgi:large subunit ribosomal protein L29